MKSIAILSAAALLAMAGGALAADLGPAPVPVEAPAPDPQAWRFQATLYGWAAGLTGDIGVHGLGPAAVSQTPIDVLEQLKGGVMGSFLAENQDWLFATDVILARLGDDGTNQNGTIAYDATLNQAIIQGAIGYRLPLDIPRLRLNATLGFRYQYLETALDIGTPANPSLLSGSGSVSWIDPTVGFWARYDFNDKWFLNAIGDIGGFGVGSDLTWQAFAAVGYNWNKTVSTSLGYRAIATDYKSGGFTYDVTQHGIMAGLGIHF